MYSRNCRGRHGHDHVVVGFTTTYAIGAYHHWSCRFYSHSRRGGQYYVIKFGSYLLQVGGFLWVLKFPLKQLTATINQAIKREIIHVHYGTISHLNTCNRLILDKQYGLKWWCLTQLSALCIYIMAVSFIGGGTGVPWENHRPVLSYWQTLSNKCSV